MAEKMQTFYKVVELILFDYCFMHQQIQGVSEICTLILTDNRTRQKEQLFHLPFCRKTMFNSKKKIGEIFH
jgi:hypothetical protein